MMRTTHRIASPLKKQIAEARDRLYRVALAWCGDEMLADDLVQETMAAAIANTQQLRNEERLSAWLYTILHNKWYRHLKRNRTHVPLDEQMPSKDYGPLGDCQQLETVNKVRRAVAALPMNERQVISLVDLEELSYCDVAQVLDIPIGTVMSRLHRARKNLLAELEERSPEFHVAKADMRVVE